MDLSQEQLQYLTVGNILKETTRIPTKSPKTFFLVTLTLILPLSLAMLGNSIFTFPLFLLIDISHPIKFLFIYELYHIILIVLAILSTSAVVFISASIYTSKPVSFLSTMSAIPNLFSRLFKTFLCISLLLSVYNLLILLVVNLVTIPESDNIFISVLLILGMVAIAFAFFHVQVYITALCFMASAVSVLEPVNGFSAFKKSYQLLKGKTTMVFFLMYSYVLISGIVKWASGIMVFGGEEDIVLSLVFRIAYGGFMVGLLVVWNLCGLVTISLFYYVCKSYHCETIDKTALFDHLGGYLGEYVPLMSDSSAIQMEVV
ncbi:uncharacterized protein LOC124929955 [Impatiens glandulifera]|uniref:uncharacterized protein LOC124929955 n=1 Tax=Impatiens glandulifera TaxID=253017 RepID=UPI001FB076FD|nr:uncharacterized protein LOC124929955 [Impatiens glandulifera]